MHLSHLKRQLVVFFAIFAMAFGSIVPSIAKAFGVDQSKSISVEVCSTSLQKIDQVVIEVPSNGHLPQNSDHCLFCVAHSPIVLQNGEQFSFFQESIKQFYPELSYSDPSLIQPWVKQPSHAPPVVSI